MLRDKEHKTADDKKGFYIDKKQYGRIAFCTSMVGSIVALGANPSFVGVEGVAKGLFMGLGTSIGASVVSLAAAVVSGLSIAGIAVALGVVSRRVHYDPKAKDIASSILAVGFFASAAVGYVGGGVIGYKMSRDFATKHFNDKKIQQSFNNSSSTKKVEIDRNNFKATIKTQKPRF